MKAIVEVVEFNVSDVVTASVSCDQHSTIEVPCQTPFEGNN